MTTQMLSLSFVVIIYSKACGEDVKKPPRRVGGHERETRTRCEEMLIGYEHVLEGRVKNYSELIQEEGISIRFQSSCCGKNADFAFRNYFWVVLSHLRHEIFDFLRQHNNCSFKSR